MYPPLVASPILCCILNCKVTTHFCACVKRCPCDITLPWWKSTTGTKQAKYMTNQDDVEKYDYAPKYATKTVPIRMGIDSFMGMCAFITLGVTQSASFALLVHGLLLLLAPDFATILKLAGIFGIAN